METISRGLIRVFILLTLGLGAQAQMARLVSAPLLRLPGISDSNSPSHWTGGKLVLFNYDGIPIRSEGESVATLDRVRAVRLYSYEHTPM